MNLCIDQGNTRTKVAVFADGKLCQTFVYEHFTREEVDSLFSRFLIKNTILSTVAYFPPDVYALLQEKSELYLPLSTSTPTAIVNPYPDLGLDRLAAAAGAYQLFPNQNLLVIDAGTAITYDFMQGNQFVAGNIAAGLRMRIKALNQHTQLLPLIDMNENEVMPLLGTTTETAIGAGVAYGIAYEIEGYIRALEQKYGVIQTILTGGDSTLLMKYLSQNLSIQHEKNLTLMGLNTILDYNLQ